MLESVHKCIDGAIEIKGRKISYKTLVTIVSVILIVLAVMFSVNKNQSRNGLYKNIAWGTSWDKVLYALEQDKDITHVVENESKLAILHDIEAPEGKADIRITGTSSFDQDKCLQEVGLMIFKEDNSNYSDDELIHELCYRFNKLYGDYTKVGSNLVWSTIESKITFMYIADGFFILEYVDINAEK